MACVMVASKLNEIYPPNIELLNEAFDYIGKSEDLIKMEALILKLCNYNIPFDQNFIKCFEDINEGKQSGNMEQLIKLLFKYLADPFFIVFENSVIAKAMSMMINE